MADDKDKDQDIHDTDEPKKPAQPSGPTTADDTNPGGGSTEGPGK